MKKKIYQSPQMKVVKITAHRMLCGSDPESQTPNERYNEVDEEITYDWFN